MWTDMGAHMGWMWLWGLAGVALLAAVVWALVRTAAPPVPPVTAEPPEAILKARYARGDIGRDEYEQRLADLRR